MDGRPGVGYGAAEYYGASNDDAEDPQAMADPHSGIPGDGGWRDGESHYAGSPAHGHDGYDDGPYAGGGDYGDYAEHGGGIPYLEDEGALGAPLDDIEDEPELNAMGRCLYRLSSVSCSGGCMFAVVWTLLQLCLTLPFLVPASILLVLFGLLQGAPTIIFRSYVAMSISRRVGCNVRVLFFILAPIALLVLLVLGPVAAGLGMLSFVITRTYMINRTDVAQVQRTTPFHTLKLLTSGVTGPCSDFFRQSEVFFLAISHGVFQFLFWLGDQRPNRHRAWPEPFEIRIDWFAISTLIAVVFAPLQALVFGVVGIVAYLPSIVTAIRRVYSDPEHFGLGLADIKASPSRCLLAFLALLALPIITAVAVALLPLLGFVLGVKSAFVAYWTTQTAWRGGFIMWNDFGPDRFSMPRMRRDSFAIWQEQQEAKLASAAVEDARITAAASQRRVGRARPPAEGASAHDDNDNADADIDADPGAGHDSAAAADAKAEADGYASGDPEAGLDAKQAVTPPRTPGPSSLPGRTVVGRVPNKREGMEITVVVPIQPGLPRPARAAPRFGDSAAPHRSPRRQPPADGFDFAADPVQTPGGPRHPMQAAGSALPPHAHGPPVEAPPAPPEAPKPRLPRGIAAACTDLDDDQRFLAKVLAFTILDIPFWDEALTTTTCCRASACSCDVFGAVLASVFWGVFGMVFMPVFGALWTILTCVPVTIRIVIAFVNPVLFPVKPAKPTALRWIWYAVIAWPLYILSLLVLPAVLVIIFAFYIVFCLVEGARVGPVQAFESIGNSPFPRAGRALGRAMRAQDHALFRFIYNRAGTTEVPGTLIGYGLSLMCDELDHPTELEQSYMDEVSLKALHATTKRPRLQGGIATEGGFIRRFDPARAGMTSARHFLTVSFLPPAQPKGDGDGAAAGLRDVDSSRRKPRRARFAGWRGDEDQAAHVADSGQGSDNDDADADTDGNGNGNGSNPDHGTEARHEDDEAETPEQRPAAEGGDDEVAPEGAEGLAGEQAGRSKAGEAAAAAAGSDETAAPSEPQAGRGEPPGRAGSCCPCCDPDSWEESLRVESAPRVLQHHYESPPRRTQLSLAREASQGSSRRAGQPGSARASSRQATSSSQRSASLAPTGSAAASAASSAAPGAAQPAPADPAAPGQKGGQASHDADGAALASSPSAEGAGAPGPREAGAPSSADSPHTGGSAAPGDEVSAPPAGEMTAELAAAAQLLASRAMEGGGADSASVDSASDDDADEQEAGDVVVDAGPVDDVGHAPHVAPPAGDRHAAAQAKPGAARFSAPPSVSVPTSPLIEEDDIIIEEDDEEADDEDGRAAGSRTTSLGGHGFQPETRALPSQAASVVPDVARPPSAAPAAAAPQPGAEATTAGSGHADDDNVDVDDDEVFVGSDTDEDPGPDASPAEAGSAFSAAPPGDDAAAEAPGAMARATALLDRLREKRASAAARPQS
ncbi:hypothetical protein FNF31_03723 [Cafeteria roenbergensis]|uniref:Uncharacterized protein n=1 Tax=Cafeteria roenbergensis TaxID=33653 RepID=A0A5A8D9R1_CAFRO|nr:hypothetical protein FNF31_03723 [Cafeteria roenbergensis]